MSFCKVEIATIVLDEESNTPIVVLQDNETGNILPIMIAPLEASLIAIELEGKKPVRPLTHDLIITMLKTFQYTLTSVIIDDLKDNIYFAKLNLIAPDNSEISIDCRPSDAIAIALRAHAPIYVKKKVFAIAQGLENLSQIDKETMKEVLEDIDIDDVGGKIM